MKLERLYFKIIETPDLKMEWFTYSTVTTIFPEYVVVTTATMCDTLCEVNSLYDVQVDSKDTIRLFFSGRPDLGQDSVSIPHSILGIPVVVDQTIAIQERKSQSTFTESRWK